MRIVLAGVFALSLAACGDLPGEEYPAGETAPEGDVQLRPGLYRMQVLIDGGAGGAASQFADDNSCLTTEDVAGGYREMLLDMQGRDSCQFESYEFTGDTLDAVMVCAGDQVTPETRAQITGTVTSESTDLQMTVAGFEEGALGIDMRVASERIGDCEASEG